MTTVNTPQKHEFQAEVKQVLDIVVHSLYTDKEIFIRELASNASDALEKLRHTQITDKDIQDEQLPLEINITTDDNAGTITFQDYGIGMTDTEMVENLGTIAHSGSKAFLEAIKKSGGNNENLIGQFGVGFYSVFMVAKEVDVYSRSWKKDGKGYCWKSDGSGSYTIEEVDGQSRGCKIVAHLKDEYKEFASKDRVKAILEQHSRFVNFPLNLNGEKINTVDALWLKSKNDIKEEDYKEFYKFQANAFDEPSSWLHFSADAPLEIKALLFVPTNNTEIFGMSRIECGVSLYCKKILIDAEPKGLLPEWMRFVRGVVDSADLPLNISRESMQDSALMQKLNKVVTKRFIKHLEELAKKDEEKFKTFWKTFGNFIKEGVSVDFNNREQLTKLVRFESSFTEKGKMTHFEDYMSRMKDDQKEIYYLVGANREAIESGPYVEAFKARGIEVIYLFEGIDDYMMGHLQQVQEKSLVSIDRDDIKLNEYKQEGEGLPEKELEALCVWIKEQLGEKKVSKVEAGDRLIDSPVLALNADKFMTPSMRRMMRAMQKDSEEPMAAPAVNLQINPRHTLIQKLASLKDENPVLAQQIAAQLLDNALIAAGLLEDPREMIGRIYDLLEKVS